MADDIQARRYTAASLGRQCGVSERTVRYYVEEGLLPPPEGRGRGANFLETHLVRLCLIRAMQQAGNDLDSIREYLREVDEEVAAGGGSLEGVLSVWSARNERAALRAQWGRADLPAQVFRYRVADGVELLVEADAALSAARMTRALNALRLAFEAED